MYCRRKERWSWLKVIKFVAMQLFDRHNSSFNYNLFIALKSFNYSYYCSLIGVFKIWLIVDHYFIIVLTSSATYCSQVHLRLQRARHPVPQQHRQSKSASLIWNPPWSGPLTCSTWKWFQHLGGSSGGRWTPSECGGVHAAAGGFSRWMRDESLRLLSVFIYVVVWMLGVYALTLCWCNMSNHPGAAAQVREDPSCREGPWRESHLPMRRPGEVSPGARDLSCCLLDLPLSLSLSLFLCV